MQKRITLILNLPDTLPETQLPDEISVPDWKAIGILLILLAESDDAPQEATGN